MPEDYNEVNIKRGYLKEAFRVVHLKDRKSMEFEAHYHDFNKVIIFISGRVTYLIEGRAYRLKPWDILFIRHDEVHKVIINSDEVYERMALWVDPDFDSASGEEISLMNCFEITAENKMNLLRVSSEYLREVQYTLKRLEETQEERAFGNAVLRKALFQELLIYFNRLLLKSGNTENTSDVECDRTIIDILDYINDNLEDDLSIDSIAARFFLSRYHIMHKFKRQTGYTIHYYILQKRLMKAHSMMKSGKTASEVCEECGFGDYSNFVKNFKKMFGVSPGKMKK